MSQTRSPLVARRAPPNLAASLDPDAAALGRLKSLAQVQRFRRRQRYSLGGTSGILVVRSGVLAITSGASPENSTIVELLYPGDILSMDLMAPLPAIALSASIAAECWKFTAQAFAAEIARDGALANHVVECLHAQRARLQLHVAILATLMSEQRVAALLIEAVCRVGNVNDSDITFDLPWSRVEVADYLSLNADTLSRIMSRLSQAGIITRLSRSQLALRRWNEIVAMCPLAESVLALHKPNAVRAETSR